MPLVVKKPKKTTSIRTFNSYYPLVDNGIYMSKEAQDITL